MSNNNKIMMHRALELARKAEGHTSPNPMVGAVLVKDGQIIGEGYHHQAGQLHAEIEALQSAGETARGATLYVNLEPCSHHGRTPPCTQALIEAGVAEVYCAIKDPNPLVNGRGYAQLEAAGIVVHQGLCEDNARKLNRPFFKFINTGTPLVTAKFATSLDGKIATRTGDSKWVSSETSRKKVHQLRNITDAILVGVGTVLADDPQLTTRIEGSDVHHPLRIIVDSRGRAPLSVNLYDPAKPGQTVLATTDAVDPRHCEKLEKLGVGVWKLPPDKFGRVNLPALLNKIGQHGMLTLLVEGGGELLGAFFTEKLVDRVWAFIAPLIIGGQDAPGPMGGKGVEMISQAHRLENIKTQILDGDIWIQGNVHYFQNPQPTTKIKQETHTCLQES